MLNRKMLKTMESQVYMLEFLLELKDQAKLTRILEDTSLPQELRIELLFALVGCEDTTLRLSDLVLVYQKLSKLGAGSAMGGMFSPNGAAFAICKPGYSDQLEITIALGKIEPALWTEKHLRWVLSRAGVVGDTKRESAEEVLAIAKAA